MTGTYRRQRGDVVTCEAMTEPHEVHMECMGPVLVERPAVLVAPFARRVAAAKAGNVRYVAVRS